MVEMVLVVGNRPFEELEEKARIVQGRGKDRDDQMKGERDEDGRVN